MTPAEKIKRRQRTGALAREIQAEMRRRLPEIPLEFELMTGAPVTDEDASLVVKTDGTAVLRVLGLANDLAREVSAGQEGIRIVPRVWPRTIWCRRSSRPEPVAPKPGERPATNPVLLSTRDARGNILLCVPSSHAGDHDFGD